MGSGYVPRGGRPERSGWALGDQSRYRNLNREETDGRLWTRVLGRWEPSGVCGAETSVSRILDWWVAVHPASVPRDAGGEGGRSRRRWEVRSRKGPKEPPRKRGSPSGCRGKEALGNGGGPGVWGCCGQGQVWGHYRKGRNVYEDFTGRAGRETPYRIGAIFLSTTSA